MAPKPNNKKTEHARRLKELKQKLKPYRDKDTVNLLRVITGSGGRNLDNYWESLESVLTGEYSQLEVKKRIQSVVNRLLENGEYAKSRPSQSDLSVAVVDNKLTHLQLNSQVNVSSNWRNFNIDSKTNVFENVSHGNIDSKANDFAPVRNKFIDSKANVFDNVRNGNIDSKANDFAPVRNKIFIRPMADICDTEKLKIFFDSKANVFNKVSHGNIDSKLAVVDNVSHGNIDSTANDFAPVRNKIFIRPMADICDTEKLKIFFDSKANVFNKVSHGNIDSKLAVVDNKLTHLQLNSQVNVFDNVSHGNIDSTANVFNNVTHGNIDSKANVFAPVRNEFTDSKAYVIDEFKHLDINGR